MRFYKLEYSTNIKEIGVSDQVQSVLQPYDYWGSNSFTQIPLEGLLEFDFQVPKLKLEKRALLTDLLHSVPTSINLLLISPQLRNVLDTVEMDDHEFFETKVIGEAINRYYFLYFPYSRTAQFVNWEKSVFAHTTFFGKHLIQEIQFDDYSQFWNYYMDAIKKNEEIRVRKLVLQNESIKVDMFRLLWTCTGTYISERLKRKLEEHSITGWAATPVEELSEPIMSEIYPHAYPPQAINS